MENIDISATAALQLKILQLKAEKTNLEKTLNQAFKEFTYMLFVPAAIKNEVDAETPETDNKALLNLSQKVLNMSTDYILEQKFGKKRPFNDFLTSMFFELISTPYVNQKIIEIFSGIRDQSDDSPDQESDE